MEDFIIEEKPFKKMVASSMPILAHMLPDGCHLPWWKIALAKIKIWGFNVPIENGIYDSSKLFKKLFDPELKGGDLKTPIAITAYIPTTDQSVISYNVPIDQIPKNVLRPEMMPHDNYRYDPITPIWVLTSQSSAIPFNFFNVPLLLPLDPEVLESCRNSCGIFNFQGHGDEKRAWQITGKGLQGMLGGNGLWVTDGAVTTNCGAVAATVDKNKIIISVYPVKKAKEIKFEDGFRWAQWKGFVGVGYQLVKACMFLFTDSTADKQQIMQNFYMKIEDENGQEEFYLPTVMAIDAGKTRKVLEEKNNRKYPDWKAFNKYDYDTTHDIFEESYNQAWNRIHIGDPENNVPRLFSDEDLVRMGHEGISCCVSGGGAAAVDEVSYVAALLDSIHQFRPANVIDIPREERSIINLLTGTSAGALTAAYFANLHDRYCSPEDR